MELTDSIKETIAKVLALADSPNENEARAALLKARAMMAKYKLREEDVKQASASAVIRRLVGVSCTAMTNPWATLLSGIIANNSCCTAFQRRVTRGKTVNIGFVGLEDDIEVCERLFKYAYDCVISACITIRAEHYKCSGSLLRQACNAYGYGFCEGLEDAYKKQSENNVELAMVLITPRQVTESLQDMRVRNAYGTPDYEGWRREFGEQGYEDGQKFDPSRRLEPVAEA